MRFVTNGTFAIPLIPECRTTSIRDWSKLTNFTIDDSNYSDLEFIIPYRNSYDRIIRAIAADLNELMLNAGLFELNKQKWKDVSEIGIEYINNWFKTAQLPIEKDFTHSQYYIAYFDNRIVNKKFINVDEIEKLPSYIQQTYNLDVPPIPDLPDWFHEHCVPTDIIKNHYNNDATVKNIIDEYCICDQELSKNIVTDFI
jgi:hypothetical protein